MLAEASLHASEAACHFTLHRVGDEPYSHDLMSSELYGQRTTVNIEWSIGYL